MPNLTITLEGRVPSKKNSRLQIVVRGKPLNIPSKQYRAWHKEQSFKLNSQKHTQAPIPKCQCIVILFYMPDDRVCDLTNKAESVMDLLVDCGIMIDDAWQITGPITIIPKGIDRLCPRVEVTITY